MTVAIVDGKIKVTLTEAETVRLNIDCVFFDKTSNTARTALLNLLKIAAQKGNFKTSKTRFIIELYPVLSGGCEVYFIPNSEGLNDFSKARPVALHNRCTIFEFDDSESMLAACEALYLDANLRYCRSSLYEYNTRFRLLIWGITPAMHKTICLNFADRSSTSNLVKAKTIEYGKVVCFKNAIAIIGAALTKKP